MSIFSNKKVAAIAAEGTFGTYETPLVPTFPINDLEIVSPELSLNEYGRPADGKLTRGRYLSGAQSAGLGFTSFMNSIQGAASAETIIAKDLFIMAGYRYREVVDTGTYPEVFYDRNPACNSYSMSVTTLECYDSTLTPQQPTGPQWQLRGAKTDLTIAAEEPGAPIIITAAVQAGIEGYEDEGAVTLDLDTYPDFSAVPCDRFLGAAVTLAAADIDVQAFSASQGNAIALRKDPSVATITKVAEITDADPKLNLTAIVGTTTAGIWADASGNVPVGDVVITGQYYTYTYKNCTVSGYSEADADGILVLNLELSVSGDIEIRSRTAQS